MDRESFVGVAAGVLLVARTEAGLTQAEVAAAAGVPTSMVSMYERGIREPTLPTLLRLLAAMGRSLKLDPVLLDREELLQRDYERSLPAEVVAAWREEQAHVVAR